MQPRKTIMAAIAIAALPLHGASAHDQGSIVLGEKVPELEGFTVYRPADLGSVQDPAPVIVWGNGACSMNHSPWLPIINRLTADGYVVIAAGDALGIRGPAAPGEVRPRYTDQDLERAVDWAVAVGAGTQSPYGGQLDASRIGLAGNSCGGVTSTALASRDDRVRSIFVLSGGAIGPNATPEERASVIGNITAPIMYVLGGEEDIARSPATKDFEVLADEVPALVVARFQGDHGMLSANPKVVTTVAEMANDWFDGTIRSDGRAIERLSTDICSTCASDVWSIIGVQSLDSLGR